MRSHLRSGQANTITMRIALSVTLVLLSGGLSLSLLHLFAPRQAEAPVMAVRNQPESDLGMTLPPVYAAPQRLTIDQITVDAPVISTGLTEDNDMDISADIAITAWYNQGPKPGEVGSAVIAGHYGRKDGRDAVFNKLHRLIPGDIISVDDETGATLRFSVTNIRTYNHTDDATQVFTSTDGKAHLNLITCGGTWNDSLQTYSDRIVVFTDLLAKS